MYKTATTVCPDCEVAIDVTVNDLTWKKVMIKFCPLCGTDNVEKEEDDIDDEVDEDFNEDEDAS